MGVSHVPTVFLLLAGCLLHLPNPVQSKIEEFNIDVKVVVDPLGVEKWKKLSGHTDLDIYRKEILSMYLGVQNTYSSISDLGDIKVYITVTEIVFAKDDILGNEPITSVEYLSKLWTWNKKQKSTSTTKQDITVLHTGRNVLGDTDGFAMIDAICGRTSTAVVEIRTTAEEIHAVAHEIGHSLNADHIKTEETLMYPGVRSDALKRLQFSGDNAVKLFNTFNTKSDCLKLVDKSKTIDKVAVPFGKLVLPDELCKRRFGNKEGHVWRRGFGGFAAHSCLFIKCMETPSDPQGSPFPVMAPDGIPCAQKGTCNRGKCMAVDEKVAPSDSCPYGDQSNILFTPVNPSIKKCSEFEKDKGNCFARSPECCDTCNPSTVDADEVCRRVEKNNASAVARAAYNDYQYICSKLACLKGEGYTDSKRFLYNIHAHDDVNTDGIRCGSKEVCQSGKCVKTTKDMQFAYGHCPLGDQPWVSERLQDCKDIAIKRNEKCGDNDIYRACCLSCHIGDYLYFDSR